MSWWFITDKVLYSLMTTNFRDINYNHLAAQTNLLTQLTKC